jgi:hypothetical protein
MVFEQSGMFKQGVSDAIFRSGSHILKNGSKLIGLAANSFQDFLFLQNFLP